MTEKLRPTNRVNEARRPFDLRQYLDGKRLQISRVLDLYLPSPPEAPEIKAAMAYSLKAGGKRLRPILCMAATEAVGGNSDHTLPAACAIEMIHTYSLIHDDLPAMDNDRLRRGVPTCHVAFSEATAILAGDALLTGAFQLLVQHALQQPLAHQRPWLEVMQLLAHAAGCEGMIEGQMRDIQSQGLALSTAMLEQLHRLKTGALISASILAGAWLANASALQRDALKRYGENIGLAFQVTDDILNVEGDPIRMGKPVGTDAALHKNTFPSLIGLEASKSLSYKLIAQALQALASFDSKADALRAIAQYVLNRRR